jgi:polyhydroxyalkanoate synthesis regulator phasin
MKSFGNLVVICMVIVANATFVTHTNALTGAEYQNMSKEEKRAYQKAKIQKKKADAKKQREIRKQQKTRNSIKNYQKNKPKINKKNTTKKPIVKKFRNQTRPKVNPKTIQKYSKHKPKISIKKSTIIRGIANNKAIENNRLNQDRKLVFQSLKNALKTTNIVNKGILTVALSETMAHMMKTKDGKKFVDELLYKQKEVLVDVIVDKVSKGKINPTGIAVNSIENILTSAGNTLINKHNYIAKAGYNSAVKTSAIIATAVTAGAGAALPTATTWSVKKIYELGKTVYKEGFVEGGFSIHEKIVNNQKNKINLIIKKLVNSGRLSKKELESIKTELNKTIQISQDHLNSMRGIFNLSNVFDRDAIKQEKGNIEYLKFALKLTNSQLNDFNNDNKTNIGNNQDNHTIDYDKFKKWYGYNVGHGSCVSGCSYSDVLLLDKIMVYKNNTGNFYKYNSNSNKYDNGLFPLYGNGTSTSDDYQYTSWGGWGNVNYPLNNGADIVNINTNKGWFVTGARTESSDIPKTGTAIYSGDTKGFTSNGNRVSGSINLITNFSSNTVDAAISASNENFSASDTFSNINLIRDTGYNRAKFSKNNTNNTWMDGTFYGSKAKEAGGRWSLKDSNSGNWASGVFRAKKQ